MVTTDITKLRERVQEDRAALNYHKKRHQDVLRDYRKDAKTEDTLKKCRTLLRAAALKIQKETKEYIDNIVSLGLMTVFVDPYEFNAVFETKHNETECRLIFKRDGKERDPIDSTGGGAVDVAAVSLRAAIQCLIGNRPFLLLDEPFKFVSPDRLPFAKDMLKFISKELSIQVVMITNNTELIKYPGWDRIIKIDDGKIVAINGKPVGGVKSTTKNKPQGHF